MVLVSIVLAFRLPQFDFFLTHHNLGINAVCRAVDRYWPHTVDGGDLPHLSVTVTKLAHFADVSDRFLLFNYCVQCVMHCDVETSV